jgi:hypothetical protein
VVSVTKYNFNCAYFAHDSLFELEPQLIRVPVGSKIKTTSSSSINATGWSLAIYHQQWMDELISHIYFVTFFNGLTASVGEFVCSISLIES